MRHYKTLTWNDRLKIDAWRRIHTSPQIMAKELGVHISTIYRELKRGQYEHLNSDYTTEIRYSPEKSEQKKQDNLRAKGAELKIGHDHDLAEYIEYMISKKKYSPAAVLGEIKKENLQFSVSLTKQTIYRYIDRGVFLALTNKDLPVKSKRSKLRHHKIRAQKPTAGKSIEKRPEEVDMRKSFGHWEMDCVEGKKGTKKTLLVLTERKTRREIIRLMKDKTADSVVKTMDGIKKEMGPELFSRVFLTITVDNGTEFSNVDALEGYCAMFYCHPYSSWERGSNENQNRLIRRHYPKGYNFNATNQAEVRRVEEWINNYPREIFGYYTSMDLYRECLEHLIS